MHALGRSPPPDADPPDERFWEEVRAQFPLRDGFVPMNAANLCPAPHAVVEAQVSALRDIEADVSSHNRARFVTRPVPPVPPGGVHAPDITSAAAAIARNTGHVS